MRLGSMNAAKQKQKKKEGQELQETAAESGSVQCILFTQIYRPDWTERIIENVSSTMGTYKWLLTLAQMTGCGPQVNAQLHLLPVSGSPVMVRKMH